MENKGQKQIKSLCPFCEVGDTFTIIDVVREAQPVDYYKGYKSGLYRCKCDTCGFVQTISSKNPPEYNPPKGDKNIDY